MAEYRWDQFTVRIPVRQNADALYRAWTRQHDLEGWFVRYSPFISAEGNPRARNEEVLAGDTYTWRWHGYGDEAEEKGKILECNGKDYLKFTFGKAGVCAVTIKPEGEMCVVEITQNDIPVDDKSRAQYHVGCQTGWTFYLAILKSIMEGGLDLRNKNEALKGVVSS